DAGAADALADADAAVAEARPLELPIPVVREKVEAPHTHEHTFVCGRRFCAAELRGEREQVDVDQPVEPVPELGHGVRLELPHALARDAQLAGDRLQRPGVVPTEAEAELDDAALPLGQPVEDAAYLVAVHRLARDLGRIRGLAVGEEVAQLAVAVA